MEIHASNHPPVFDTPAQGGSGVHGSSAPKGRLSNLKQAVPGWTTSLIEHEDGKFRQVAAGYSNRVNGNGVTPLTIILSGCLLLEKHRR
ncbi:MAG: hypothetical protein ACYC5A_08025 [Thermoleophilia bacterium]